MHEEQIQVQHGDMNGRDRRLHGMYNIEGAKTKDGAICVALHDIAVTHCIVAVNYTL